MLRLPSLFTTLLCLLLLKCGTVYAAQLLSTGEDVETFVQSKLDDHEVMVFAKTYCPHCKRAKQLLTELQEYIEVEVEYLNLDQLPRSDGPLIQDQLKTVTGQRTVPNIFIGQKHVGGNSDIQQLNALGKLEVMLLEASGATEL